MTNTPETKKASVLSKKLIRKCYINWMCFNLSLYQPETMQAPAMVKMFGDIREDLYPNCLLYTSPRRRSAYPPESPDPQPPGFSAESTTGTWRGSADFRHTHLFDD